MNQKRFSFIDLEEQAKHHEELALALRLVIKNIRIPNSEFNLDIVPKKRVATAKARKAISRGMRAYWRKRKAGRS